MDQEKNRPMQRRQLVSLLGETSAKGLTATAKARSNTKDSNLY